MDSSLHRSSQSYDSLSGRSLAAGGVQHVVRQIRGRTHQLWNTLLGRQQVHMLHIGKTGGTAIKASLCQSADHTCINRSRLGRVTKASFRRTPRGQSLIVRLYPHGYTLRDVPVGEKLFFFVRDPLARFVSGFYSRQRQGQPRVMKPWSPAEAAAFARFETPNALAGALASRDPSTRATAEAAMRGITHVQSSYWDWFHDPAYFESRLNDVLLVGFQETLDSDFELLKSLLDLPSHVRLPTDAIASHRAPPGLDRTLDSTSQAILREWYARDYKFVELSRSLRSRSCRRECA
jgi:Sulfotransferase family